MLGSFPLQGHFVLSGPPPSLAMAFGCLLRNLVKFFGLY